MAEPQVRGMAFRGIVGAFQRLHGAERLADVKKALPDDLARLIEYRTIVSGNWYPIDAYRQLLQAIVGVLGRGPDVVGELSREATLEDFRGIYRILTFVLSPEFLIKRAPGLWGRYYDTGTLAVPEARAGFARAVYTGCRGFDRMMWLDAFNGSAAILEACGAKNVKLLPQSGGGDRDENAEMVARWD